MNVADAFVPSIALGIFLTRIGCFYNGCCFGKVCRLPRAVVFPDNSFAGQEFPGLYIHPTQWYASLYGLVIFGVLLASERKSTGSGYLFGLFLILYSVCRFAVDFLRFYDASSIALTLSGVNVTHYQLISIGLFAVGWSVLLTCKRRKEERARAIPQ